MIYHSQEISSFRIILACQPTLNKENTRISKTLGYQKYLNLYPIKLQKTTNISPQNPLIYPPKTHPQPPAGANRNKSRWPPATGESPRLPKLQEIPAKVTTPITPITPTTPITHRFGQLNSTVYGRSRRSMQQCIGSRISCCSGRWLRPISW